MTSVDLPTPSLARDGLASVPTIDETQKRKDFASDQEVRWCPGCGDYVVLAAVQGFLPELGLKRENIVFVWESAAPHPSRTTSASTGCTRTPAAHPPPPPASRPPAPTRPGRSAPVME